MQSLQHAARLDGISGPFGLRFLIQNHGVHTLGELLIDVALTHGEPATMVLPGNYRLIVEPNQGRYSVRILAADGTGPGVDVPTDKLGDDKTKQVAKDIGKKVSEYFTNKADDIKNGRIKAEEIGGALYGIAAVAILPVFGLGAAAGTIFAEVLGFAFVPGASQVGKYYGAIVDDFVAIIKGEDKPNLTALVGVMSTLFFTQAIIPDFGAGVRLIGADGWSITRKVGEEVGDVLKDAVDKIDSVTGIGGVLGDVGEFFENIFS